MQRIVRNKWIEWYEPSKKIARDFPRIIRDREDVYEMVAINILHYGEYITALYELTTINCNPDRDW